MVELGQERVAGEAVVAITNILLAETFLDIQATLRLLWLPDASLVLVLVMDIFAVPSKNVGPPTHCPVRSFHREFWAALGASNA